MKNILLIGVGGTGSNAVDILYQKIKEFGKQNDNRISAVVFDTDAGAVSEISSATAISMADSATVGAICDRIGNQYLREWFPCDDASVRSQEMIRGASQWRKKSYLAFMNLMNKQSCRSAFHYALEKMVVDSAESIEIYVIASIAGGTGSGSFIPIALYAKKYMRTKLGKSPIVNAMIALPEIYEESQPADNRIKIYANAYAILRELNAINLVSRGYNRERTIKKRAPIRLKIGSDQEKGIGLLFDASDPIYWTPEAAPFKQVYLLDKLPNVTSIRSHDIILANSLYTILCTDIGLQFDSAASNQEASLSQSNGSNAIYGGISTSQLHYPKDTILDYLAHVKTMETCEGEWLVLHRETEERIHEEEMRAKEMRRRFNMTDGLYAKFFLDALKQQYDVPTSTVTDLVDRATAIIDRDGKVSPKNTVDIYVEQLMNAMYERMYTSDVIEYESVRLAIASRKLVKRPGWFSGNNRRGEVTSQVAVYYEELVDFYASCVEVIRNSTSGLADAIFTVDDRKDLRANPSLSLVGNLLMKNGNFIHPVAAMVQLCRMKQKLHAYLGDGGAEWPELKMRSVDSFPMHYFPTDSQSSNASGIKPHRSNYLRLGSARFSMLMAKAKDYVGHRTDVYSDSAYVKEDVLYALEKAFGDAVHQLRRSVLQRISKHLDVLIEKYRNFFSRFEEAKEDYAEEVKVVLRRDEGRIDSIVNVMSGEEHKISILKDVFGNSGPMDDAQVTASENISGGSVFRTTYSETVAEVTGIEDLSVKSGKSTFQMLFNDMTTSYRETIGQSSAFAKYGSYNVVQAIEASCGKNPDAEAIGRAVERVFNICIDLAKPALRVSHKKEGVDVVTPSEVTVVMLSHETAKYIKKRAEVYGLRQSGESDNEEKQILSAAEEFVQRYSGNDGVRVIVVPDIPNHVMYFTGQIVNITPILIDKLDELGGQRVYFTNYRTALEYAERYDTDMWNPHLGYNLHKRGYLPYMNEQMEVQCDVRLMKALLFGISQGEIMLKDESSRLPPSFRYVKDGIEHMIFASDGSLVTRKNIAQLLSWLRNEDLVIEEWSDKFDDMMRREASSLPSAASKADLAILKTALSKLTIMRMFHNDLFTVKTKGAKKGSENTGIGIFEFAYNIKTSEESLRDCDDAERILTVAFDVFKQLIEYRIKPKSNPLFYEQVYTDQLLGLLEKFSASPSIGRKPADRRAYFERVLNWANDCGTFLMIHHELIDATGDVRIDTAVDVSALDSEIQRNLDAEVKGKSLWSNAREDEEDATQNTVSQSAPQTPASDNGGVTAE